MRLSILSESQVIHKGVIQGQVVKSGAFKRLFMVYIIILSATKEYTIITCHRQTVFPTVGFMFYIFKEMCFQRNDCSRVFLFVEFEYREIWT